ncbi:MAG: hypothetical protein A2Y12_06710 [Planctomycetes bacterium GWF2_42_9]|nr:MAG: hypothetical protein A2Y12_06710 [Planctomycetes bacterium GWF2_42_9]HAL46106.1 DNA-binding protein [Phycisphaerales bacterium]
MEYAIGKAGRVAAARLFEGENLYDCIESIASKEQIKCAAVLITGGIRKADVVVGPKVETPKIEPNFFNFTGPGETLGVGTIYCDEGVPKLHIHAGIGRGEVHIVGCPRGGASVFLILEVTIIEIVGINAAREKDPQTGLKLLRVASC